MYYYLYTNIALYKYNSDDKTLGKFSIINLITYV